MAEKPDGLGGIDALANLVKHFIIRDIIYAISGGLLIVSVTYAWGSLSSELGELGKAPTVASLLLIGVAWAVGYGVSDALGGIVPGVLQSLVRFVRGAKAKRRVAPPWWIFVRTDYIHEPQRFPKYLFEEFAQQEWQHVKKAEVPPDDFRHVAAELIGQEFGSYHRTVLLRHLGSAVGACGFLASVIAGAATYRQWNPLGAAFAGGGLIVSLLLLAIGWVKALQQTYEINRAVIKRREAGSLSAKSVTDALAASLDKQIELLRDARQAL